MVCKKIERPGTSYNKPEQAGVSQDSPEWPKKTQKQLQKSGIKQIHCGRPKALIEMEWL